MKPLPLHAFVAHIILKTDRTIIDTPNFLLGCCRKHVSSPFADRRDAVAFAEQSIQVNRQRPGHSLDVIEYEIHEVGSTNPIPYSGLYGPEVL